MQRTFILAIFILFPLSIFSQDELKIINSKNKDLQTFEEFTVIKSDKSTKQGEYRLYLKEKLISKGQFENNRQVGIWEFYRLNGDTDLKYDFSTDQILINNQKGGDTSLERPIVFLGSMSELINFVSKNSNYPRNAAENSVSGKVVIRIHFSETGEIINYEILNNVYPSIDAEALRVAREIENKWLPARDNGIQVKSYFDVTISFSFA